jgi:pimeloyl-ACP methyl ester carboxylesterase
MASYKPPLVFTVHGIRTHAVWQKRLSDLLGASQIPTETVSYGYYSLPKFVLPFINDRMVEAFYEQYQQAVERTRSVDTADYRKRPSVIAHSFGTYIVGHCMLKYEDVRFDKVILCGSVLPVGFDWSTLMHRDQVFLVRNEFGLKDVWTRLVGWVVRKTGPSGAKGFAFESVSFFQQQFDHFKHSDFFARGHIREHWLPFLAREPFPLTFRHGRDIDDRAEFAQMLDTTRNAIDAESYGALPYYPEVALPPQLSLTWIEIEPDIYTFLVDRRRGAQPVKGYINAMPMEPDAFARIKRGELEDNEVTADHVAAYQSGEETLLYLMSIAVAADARKLSRGLMNQALEKLLCGLVDKLEYYRVAHGVWVKELVGVGWTPHGRKLARLIGMKEIASDRFGNPVLWVDLSSPEFLERRHAFHPIKRLAQAYRRRNGRVSGTG